MVQSKSKKTTTYFLCLGGEGATASMAQSRKRGHNLAKLGPTEKKCVCLFFVLTLHIKFQIPSSSCSLVLQQQKV